jgi:hypothetical protein
MQKAVALDGERIGGEKLLQQVEKCWTNANGGFALRDA